MTSVNCLTEKQAFDNCPSPTLPCFFTENRKWKRLSYFQHSQSWALLFSLPEISAMLKAVEESLAWRLALIWPFSTHVTLNRNINCNQKWEIKHHFLFNMHINNEYKILVFSKHHNKYCLWLALYRFGALRSLNIFIHYWFNYYNIYWICMKILDFQHFWLE